MNMGIFKGIGVHSITAVLQTINRIGSIAHNIALTKYFKRTRITLKDTHPGLFEPECFKEQKRNEAFMKVGGNRSHALATGCCRGSLVEIDLEPCGMLAEGKIAIGRKIRGLAGC
jgi:hypothetical protein